MASENDKLTLPPYVSYSSLISFINGLRENPIPLQIDRTVMPKASGSQISATVSALKFLKWLDQNSKPTEAFKQFAKATDETRPELLKKTLEHSYPFLFDVPDFHLERATGQMMAEKFRALGASGATLSKAIGFFLGAAKAAGIQVSAHIKPPSVVSSKPSKRASSKKKVDEYEEEEEQEFTETGEVQRFQIPIPGKPSAVFIIPADLEDDDWAMLKLMLDAYITRMRKQQAGQSKEKVL